MTDSEKITAIIRDKQLSNVQFCQATGIQPSALSHIFSGRTKPSLSLLRGIASGFPDINPDWIFLDRGEMYGVPAGASSPVEEKTSLPDSGKRGGGTPDQPTLWPADEVAEQDGGRPGASDLGDATPSAQAPTALPLSEASIPSTPAAANPSSPSPTQPGGGAPLPDLSSLVADAMAQMKARQRKIVDIRVFFDDGTFEVLVPKRD